MSCCIMIMHAQVCQLQGRKKHLSLCKLNGRTIGCRVDDCNSMDHTCAPLSVPLPPLSLLLLLSSLLPPLDLSLFGLITPSIPLSLSLLLLPLLWSSLSHSLNLSLHAYTHILANLISQDWSEYLAKNGHTYIWSSEVAEVSRPKLINTPYKCFDHDLS